MDCVLWEGSERAMCVCGSVLAFCCCLEKSNEKTLREISRGCCGAMLLREHAAKHHWFFNAVARRAKTPKSPMFQIF
jgi:hypothetical protein